MNALLINNLNSCNIHKTLYPRFINSPKGGKQISLIHFETDFNNNNCNADFDNFRVIGSARNDYALCLKESLLIQLYNYDLNKSVKSMPLKLFD